MTIETKNPREILRSLEERLVALRGHLDVDGKRKRVAELFERSAAPDFWANGETAQSVLKEQARLQKTVESWDKQWKALEDARVLLELGEEAKDDATLREATQEAEKLGSAIAQMEFSRMLSGEHDRQNAILDINAGAGGTDAQDWAEMLMRMYLRWAQEKGFKAEVVDVQAGEEAGIKSAEITIEGEWAYGLLRAEDGVHRLVRISPFDANARRQTAFAAVKSMPDIEQDIKIEVRDEDLRVDVYRSSGAGGQHVNKTESAVRLTHLPSGIVVACQNERSQHKNKATAMRILKAKLYELEQRKQQEKFSAIAGEKKAIEWGSQIRSYVLAPYRLVTDHRTDLKVGNVDAVLDGKIDEFISAYLLQQASEKEQSKA
ncbi:MAG TPA: peptide chain release factor 2 [Polyangia bacterium]|nr:peptide chain release factor 2 [Polyangia bacterium]